MASKPAPYQTLQSHWHHDVSRALAGCVFNLHAGDRVRQQDTDGFAFQRVQHIQHVANVEADFQLGTRIGDIQNLFCLFLLWVIGRDFNLVLTHIQTHTAEFLV